MEVYGNKLKISTINPLEIDQGVFIFFQHITSESYIREQRYSVRTDTFL